MLGCTVYAQSTHGRASVKSIGDSELRAGARGGGEASGEEEGGRRGESTARTPARNEHVIVGEGRRRVENTHPNMQWFSIVAASISA